MNAINYSNFAQELGGNETPVKAKKSKENFIDKFKKGKKPQGKFTSLKK